MDYKELIEQLQRLSRTRDALIHTEVSYACADAATAIETLLAEREAAGWISVKARLPENESTIEKHIEGGSFGFLTCLVYNGVVKQTNRFFCDAPKLGLPKTDGWEWASSNVTHWMPLPTPPDRERTETI